VTTWLFGQPLVTFLLLSSFNVNAVGISFPSIYVNTTVIRPYREVYTVNKEVKVSLLTCKHVGRVEV